jgi:hypothetical protein
MMSTRPAGGGDPTAENEELEVLKAVYGSGAGGSDPTQVEAEVKVCNSSPRHLKGFSNDA